MEEMDPLSLNFWLAKFIQVANNKGGLYPERTLYEIAFEGGEALVRIKSFVLCHCNFDINTNVISYQNTACFKTHPPDPNSHQLLAVIAIIAIIGYLAVIAIIGC